MGEQRPARRTGGDGVGGRQEQHPFLSLFLVHLLASLSAPVDGEMHPYGAHPCSRVGSGRMAQVELEGATNDGVGAEGSRQLRNLGWEAELTDSAAALSTWRELGCWRNHAIS